MTTNRNTRFKLWAGLLILSSLAPLVVVADENTSELQIAVDEGLVSLTVRDVPLQDVVQEIAVQLELRLVQHVTLDRLVSIDIERQPLPEVLDDILEGESYQLYRPWSRARLMRTPVNRYPVRSGSFRKVPRSHPQQQLTSRS